MAKKEGNSKLFGIMRVEKRKQGDITGLEIENNRTSSTKKNFDNSDIDKTRTDENVFLKNSAGKEIRTEGWEDEIFRQIAEAKVKVRGISKGEQKTNGKTSNKNASVLMFDVLYTASRDFFLEDTEEEEEEEERKIDKQKAISYFQDCLKFHIKKFCNGDESRLLNAVIHFDETTPHLHIVSVPIYKDTVANKFRLSAKDIIGGHTSDMRVANDEFYEAVSKNWGLERGDKRSKAEKKEHLKVAQYRVLMADEQLAKKEKELNKLTRLDEEIEDKNGELAEKNEELAKKSREIAKIGEEITQLDSKVKVKKTIISNKEQEIEGKNQELEKKNQELESIIARITNSQEQLEAIQEEREKIKEYEKLTANNFGYKDIKWKWNKKSSIGINRIQKKDKNGNSFMVKKDEEIVISEADFKLLHKKAQAIEKLAIIAEIEAVKENKDLKKLIARLEEQRRELEKQIKAKNQEIETKQEEIKNQDFVIDTLTDKLKSLEELENLEKFCPDEISHIKSLAKIREMEEFSISDEQIAELERSLKYDPLTLKVNYFCNMNNETYSNTTVLDFFMDYFKECEKLKLKNKKMEKYMMKLTDISNKLYDLTVQQEQEEKILPDLSNIKNSYLVGEKVFKALGGNETMGQMPDFKKLPKAIKELEEQGFSVDKEYLNHCVERAKNGEIDVGILCNAFADSVVFSSKIRPQKQITL